MKLKRIALPLGVTLLTLWCVTGCLSGTSENLIKEKIISYIENNGQAKAEAYIDRLVADGRLGSANAKAIKAALPQGIEKVKEVINKIGESK